MDKSAKQQPPPEAQSAPQYKGIRLRKWGKWVYEVRMPKSRAKIWLGSYDTARQAARAYDAAILCLRGPKATLNFPDCIPLIPCASSLSRKQIQVAAAKYALHQIPSYPNPDSTCNNSNSALTEKEPQSPPMCSSVSQTEPSTDNLQMWDWPGAEQETSLWDSFMWDLEKLPSLENTGEIWKEEEGHLGL